MAYEALARRYRPKKFDEMIGQEHVLRALTNALDHDRLHHAYLFTGTRGVGKTTVARIFAKSLNCENGISSSPCGECSACKQVDEGRFLDLIEVDAASRTGVDDTRELLDNMAYAPGSGRYKVYLIDEVHMFSKSSFNALLKTLEEPPPHVKFLLATTDPQKLPITVLSRCLQFNLKQLPDQLLRPYLGKLLDKESVEYEEGAVAHIARAADGSVRDALSLLDQAIAYGQGKVSAAEVEAMLGRFSPSRLYDLLDALARDRGDEIFEHVDALAEYVPDYGYVLGELLGLLHQLALLQTIDKLRPGEVHDEQRLRAFAAAIAPEDVQLWYQIGLLGRRDLPFAPDQRQALEMTLIRMLAFKPAMANAPEQIAQAGAAAPQVAQSAPPARKPAVAKPRADTASVTKPARPAPPAKVVAAPSPEKVVPRAATASKPVGQSSKASDSVPESRSEPEPQLPPAQLSWETEQWGGIVAELPVSGMPLQLARNCVLVSASGDQVLLRLDPEYETLAAPRWKERLREKLSVYAAGEVQLKVEVPKELTVATPALAAKQAEQARLQSAHAAITEDPVVKEICDKFGGTVNTGSIKPIDDETKDKED
ncbi:DNA polymerase III, subunit gamma and tau [Chromatiales bacterium (ex Bugula neritina AB1)]|nr:DNA polymerase III, subunit gamma and tau [Chromatiales bacterium (ex Bugula neritina AB1)]